jgi:DNA-binding CsgD family transcriptional regulator
VPTRTAAGQALLERDRELDELTQAIGDARAGSGRLVVVEGSAGIGKTQLVKAAHASADADGFCVLAARGGELEREFPFGVVRQLFEPTLAALPRGARDQAMGGAASLAAGLFAIDGSPPAHAGEEASAAMLHGLYWLAVNLSARAPLLVAVDDLHWCDAPSLRWLGYLARRLEGLPVLLLAATRPAIPDDDAAPLAALASDPAADVVRPEPLSRAAVAAMVRQQIRQDADPGFCEACHSATDGNPFLVRELLAALAAEGVQPIADAAARVATLGPRAVARSVNLRLAQLPPEAVALARAVAILGEQAGLQRAAAVAGVDTEEAAHAADLLVRAGVLESDRRIGFTHSIVRAAVYAELPPGERALSHAGAARALAAENAPIGEIAAHLLAATPVGDPWAVDMLVAAARHAQAQGAPDVAAAHLQRALAEPPAEELRATLLAELGMAEAQAQVPHAIEHLSQALDLTSDTIERGKIALELGRTLTMAERLHEAVAVLDEARRSVVDADRELAMRLDADLIDAARMNLGTRAIVGERLDAAGDDQPPDTAAGRALLAHLAFESVVAGRRADEAAEMAERALGGGLVRDTGVPEPAYYVAAYTLSLCDRVEASERWLDEGMRRSRDAGAALGFATGSCFKAIAVMRRGDVVAAEANARTALDVGREHGFRIGLPMSMAVLVNALIERGQVDEAEEALAAGELEADSGSMSFTVLMFSRGRLRALRGDLPGARDDLLACGRQAIEWGSKTPTFFPWRSTAALLLNAMGDRTEAERLVDEELEMARAFGAPTPIGLSLTAAGLMRDGDAGIAALREAVGVLETAPALLARARALTFLGMKTRIGGDDAGAREPLRTALDLAHRCGATGLVDQAHAELVATGARPRRPALSGSAALTPSELRVATMAAEGMTNAEIAQSLWVTPRTVEQHLSRCYRKLAIASRSQLAEALAAPSRADG